MRSIKVIAWIVTGIFTLLFLTRIIVFMSASSNTISDAHTFGYVIGLLLGSAVIPGILWLIVDLTKKKK